MTRATKALRLLPLLLLPLLLVGCAQNSIFELTLQTPPPEMGRDKVVIEARLGAEADFDADWQQTQIRGLVMEPFVDNTLLASFEASGDDMELPLKVKVRFCLEERCTDVADGNAPEVRYEFERVFYRGRFTSNEQIIVDYPTDPSMPPETDVGKCDIVGEGCWEGATDNNCLGDGRHFCEDT